MRVCVSALTGHLQKGRGGDSTGLTLKQFTRCPRAVDTPPITSTRKLRPFLVCNSDNVFCGVRIKFIKIIIMISLWRLSFETRPCQIEFVVYREVLGQVPFPVLRFAPVSIIPAMLRNRHHLNTVLMRRTSGRRLETRTQRNALSEAIGKVGTFMLSCLQDSDANSIYKQTYFQNILEENGEVL